MHRQGKRETAHELAAPHQSGGGSSSGSRPVCRPSRTPATSSHARNGSTGRLLNGEPHTRPIRITKTACCRSWRVATSSSSPRIMHLTTMYGSSPGRGTHPATSASWCSPTKHPWSRAAISCIRRRSRSGSNSHLRSPVRTALPPSMPAGAISHRTV